MPQPLTAILGSEHEDPTQLAIPWSPPPHLSSRERRQRHLDAIAAARVMPDVAGHDKAEAIARVRAELLSFVASQPIGTEFQAMVFRARLHERGIDIAPADPRCLGGLFAQLRQAGVIALVGMEPTGGYRPTNSNSTTHAVWRVVSHAFADLHWSTT